MISNKRIYVNKAGDIVSEDSQDAAYLLVGKNCEIDDNLARKYELFSDVSCQKNEIIDESATKAELQDDKPEPKVELKKKKINKKNNGGE